jgi:iron complex transport system ATP-binding protein
VLHDLNLAASFASRVLVLAGGRVVSDGPPHAVLQEDLIAEVFGPGLAVGCLDGHVFVLPVVPR